MTEKARENSQKDPEVVEKAARRRFTAEYKRRIALEAEQCEQSGEIGALLRREGLYSSVVAQWRRQLQEESLSSSKKSRKNGKLTPAQEVARLEREKTTAPKLFVRANPIAGRHRNRLRAPSLRD